MNPPLIKIEIEHMRQSMVHAFSEHTIKMDSLFKDAIERACHPDAVRRIVYEAANQYLRQALDDEVKNFLTYGDGRKLVRSEVEKRLKEDFEIL
jgi:hypothetical protein